MFDGDQAVEALTDAVAADGLPQWTVFDRDDGDPDGFELRDDPGRMLGWRAPAQVWAIGMVAGATATVLDERGLAPERCQVACVVDRWGSVSARVRYADGRELVDGPQAGRVLDILRRCLGLATPPADEPLAGVMSMVWLVAVAVASRRRHTLLRWSDAIALHPIVHLLDPLALGSTPVDLAALRSADIDGRTEAAGRPGDPLASVVAAALGRWSWADVRSRCIERQVTIADVTPALASWMDDGMVSRWLGESHNAVEVIVDAAFEAIIDDDHEAITRLLLLPGDDLWCDDIRDAAGPAEPSGHHRRTCGGHGARRRR